MTEHRHLWTVVLGPRPFRRCAICKIRQGPWLMQQCTCTHRRVNHDHWFGEEHTGGCLMCDCLRYN